MVPQPYPKLQSFWEIFQKTSKLFLNAFWTPPAPFLAPLLADCWFLCFFVDANFWLILVLFGLPLPKMTLCDTPMVPKAENVWGIFQKYLNYFQIHSGPPSTIPSTPTGRLLIFALFDARFGLNLAVFNIWWAAIAKNDPLQYPNGTQSWKFFWCIFQKTSKLSPNTFWTP